MINGQPCKLLLANVQVSPRLQCRVKLDAKSLKALTDALARGDEFAPILVYRIDGDLWVVDGHHRLETIRKAGVLGILATVIDGTWTEAVRAALTANRGVRLTTSDREKAVLLASKEFPNLGDRAIAELCGVSYKTVARVGRRTGGTVSQVAKMRQGRDGKFYPPKKNSAKSRPAALRKDSLAAQASESTQEHDSPDGPVAPLPSASLNSTIPPSPLASEQVDVSSTPALTTVAATSCRAQIAAAVAMPPAPGVVPPLHPSAALVRNFVGRQIQLHPTATTQISFVLQELLDQLRSSSGFPSGSATSAPIVSQLNRTQGRSMPMTRERDHHDLISGIAPHSKSAPIA